MRLLHTLLQTLVGGFLHLGSRMKAPSDDSTVSAATTTHFQAILGDTTTDYLASVATYADSYRYTSAGLYSKPFHFIDANDDPPSSAYYFRPDSSLRNFSDLGA